MSLDKHKQFFQKSLSPFVPNESLSNIYLGKVMFYEDTHNSGRLKIFVDGVDNPETFDSDLPWSYPLLSRIIHVMPKPGEVVLVLFANSSENLKNTFNCNRFWVGPILPNYERIENAKDDVDGRVTGDLDFLITRNVTEDPLHFTKSRDLRNNEKNIFPIDGYGEGQPNNLDDVTIVGRKNTEIVQTDSKIVLKAGKHKRGDVTKENTENPVYSVLEFIDDKTSYNLTVGDEIFIVSHKGKYQFKKKLTKDDIDELRKNSESMLYGNLTIKYLKILTNAFLNHIHQHPQNQPIENESLAALKVQLQNIENLLAKNIKIN